jgi:hypothetical protein
MLKNIKKKMKNFHPQSFVKIVVLKRDDTYLCRKKGQNLGYDGVKPLGNLRLKREKRENGFRNKEEEEEKKDSIKAGMKPQ